MSAEQPCGNLSADVSSFVGRTRSLAAVKRLLAKTRLVTLTGAGGVGKTRLALHLGHTLRRVYPDGVWLVELAALDDPALLAPTLAKTLGVRDWNNRPVIEVLTGYLADRQLLLILDNCEHLAQACAVVVHRLLTAAPGLRIITTSRRPLDSEGEHILLVPSLSLPAPEAALTMREAHRYEAIALFADRAAEACPGFTVGPDNLASVVELCRKLDGIPLAIELAAARMPTLSVEQIRDRLNDRFDLLAKASPAASPRHQTLRAAIAWSFELCSLAERRLWARASVFAGEVGLDAAEEVCAGEGITRAEVLGLLSGLLDESILARRETTPSGPGRYQMLDTIRAYGGEYLCAVGEHARLRRRHCAWLLALAERCTIEWWGPAQLEWMARLSAEHANLRAALEFCVTEHEVQLGFRLVSGLRFYWVACWLLTEVRQWVSRLERLDPQPTVEHGLAVWVAGWAAIHQGEPAVAAASARRCNELSQQLRDDQVTAHAIHLSAEVAFTQGDLAGARALYSQARDAFCQLAAINVPAAKTLVMSGLVASMVASVDGRADDAVRYAEESMQVTATDNEKWAYSCGLTVLGLALWQRGQAHEAIPRLRESLAIKQTFNDLFGLGLTFDILAWCLTAVGDYEQAARAFGAADRIWPLIGVQLLGSPPLIAHRRHNEATARAALGSVRFEANRRAGAQDDAIRQDRDNSAAGKRGNTVPAPLTRREWEVATLVAKGMSNKDIAMTLSITQRTAEGYIENLLAKLGLTSRTQIARWARDHSPEVWS